MSTSPTIPTVFIHTTPTTLTQPTHVVVSPRYYYTTTADFEIKSQSQARKIAASLFEQRIPQGEYTYDVHKKDGTFIFIAYNKEQILDALKTLGIATEKIKTLALAQWAFETIDYPLAIDEAHTLLTIDNIVCAVPQKYIDTPARPIKAALNSLGKKQRRISVGHIAGIDILAFKVPLIAVAALVMLQLAITYTHHSMTLNQLKAQTTDIKTTYKLPPTMVQLKSIQNNLLDINTKQSFIRNNLYKLSKNRAGFDGKIVRIDTSHKSFSIDIDNATKAIDEKVKKLWPTAVVSKKDTLTHIEVVR